MSCCIIAKHNGMAPIKKVILLKTSKYQNEKLKRYGGAQGTTPLILDLCT
jgi:hypothetical protein